MIIKTNHRLVRPLAAAFVGALTTLAFAPYQIWIVAILSPLFLLLLLSNQSTKRALSIGFSWGFGQFAVGISWVHISIDTFGGLPKAASLMLMLLLVSYLALYPALFAGILNRWFPKENAARFLLAVPSLWLIAEWLRGWVMTGFPWLLLGYSQIDSPLSFYAPIGGVDTITYLLLLMAGALALAITQKQWHFIGLPLGIFALAGAIGMVQWVKEETENPTKFALIQGNISQELKWLPSQRWPTIMKYMDLTRENWDADVVIWPEAAIPAFENELPSFLSNLDSAGRLNNTGIITGIVTSTSREHFYNSVIAVGENEQTEYNRKTQPKYHKHHLLPFGEFVPFGEILRPIAPFFNLPMSSFSRGGFVQDNIESNGRYFAPALCYEIIFNEQVRQNITEDTDFILTLSNDAWFGDSIGPHQHMEIARMRALELGRPLVRTTNNGVTAITDYKGKITHQVPQFKTEVLVAEVNTATGMTPYRILGLWPLYLIVLLSLSISYLYVKQVEKSV
ncbi:apolipoprotein N-acyltransferase [Vibrio nigripulchritudo]|uniref:apolipoprotein N-acyltransferase n=1 Tax=Vibrio nigripulchritudo TaxID=28173 RepID=UPI0005FA2B03|nr:apolipoprotein N-acyltransferase [Vibrio nigripulchritudo]KJY80175.1 apolipoprotein acyltransferase [Vibrio nigripulchritudo]